MRSLNKSIPPNEQLQHILSDASEYRQNEDGIWLNSDISRNRDDRPVLNGRTIRFAGKQDIDAYDARTDGYGYGIIKPSSTDPRAWKEATLTIKFISVSTNTNFLFGYLGSSFLTLSGSSLYLRVQGTADTTITSIVNNASGTMNVVTMTITKEGFWRIYQNGYLIYSRLVYTDGFLWRNIGGRGDGAFYLGNYRLIEFAAYNRVWKDYEHVAHYEKSLHDISNANLHCLYNGECGGGMTVFDLSGNGYHSRIQNLTTLPASHEVGRPFKGNANNRGYNHKTYIEYGSFISTNYTPSLANIYWKHEFDFHLMHQISGSNMFYLGNRHGSVASGNWYTLYVLNASAADDTHMNCFLGYAFANNYPEYYSASQIPGTYKVGDRVTGWVGQEKGGKLRLVINVNGVNKFDQEFFVDGLSFTRNRISINGGREISQSPVTVWRYSKLTIGGEVIGEFDFTKPFNIDNHPNWYLDGDAVQPLPYIYPENYSNKGYDILGEKISLVPPRYPAIMKSAAPVFNYSEAIELGNIAAFEVTHWELEFDFIYNSQADENTIVGLQHTSNFEGGITVRLNNFSGPWNLIVWHRDSRLLTAAESGEFDINKYYHIKISYINGNVFATKNGEVIKDAPVAVSGVWGTYSWIGRLFAGGNTERFSGNIFSVSFKELDVNGNLVNHLIDMRWTHASDVAHNVAPDAPLDHVNQIKRTYDFIDHTNPGHITNSQYGNPFPQREKQYIGKVDIVKNAGNIYDGDYYYAGNQGYGIDSAGRFYNWQEMGAYTAIHLKNITDLEGIKVKFKFNIYRLNYTGDGFRLVNPDATFTLITDIGYYETEGVMGKAVWRTVFGGLYSNLIWQAGNSIIHDIYFDFDIEIIGPNWRKPQHDLTEVDTSIVLNPSGKWQVDGEEELIMNPYNASEFSFGDTDSKSYSDIINFEGMFIREDA
jgi:hypothetical protein